MSKHPGMVLNADGYLRIKARRNGLRDQLAHRAYAARQLGRKTLPSEFEVHHECMNRACWPPTDFHLVIVDQALAPHMYQRRGNKKAPRRRAA